MKTKKPGRRPRSFLQKIKIFLGVIVGISVISGAAYLLCGYFNYWQLNSKAAELSGLRLYSVQESNYTHAFSWYASYPKIDDPVFDRAASKIVNDAKGTFLAKVNFDAPTKWPQDDLNTSFVVDSSTESSLSVRLTIRQSLHGAYKEYTKVVSYSRTSHSIKITDGISKNPWDESTMAKKGDLALVTPKVNCGIKKCVALTFDGGPTYVTPRLLNILKDSKAKATFFELGAQAHLYPSTAKRTVAEGHAIGNGTYNYRNLLTLSSSDAIRELNAGSDAIKAATGARPGIARAPYGAVTADTVKKTDMPFIGWSVDSGDTTGGRADAIYNTVMSQIKPGAIVKSHDIREETVDAYGRIIPDLTAKGYELVTVPQLLGLTSDAEPRVYANP